MEEERRTIARDTLDFLDGVLRSFFTISLVMTKIRPLQRRYAQTPTEFIMGEKQERGKRRGKKYRVGRVGGLVEPTNVMLNDKRPLLPTSPNKRYGQC